MVVGCYDTIASTYASLIISLEMPSIIFTHLFTYYYVLFKIIYQQANTSTCSI